MTEMESDSEKSSISSRKFSLASSNSEKPYRVYKERWFVFAVVAMQNLSINGWVLSYGGVANVAAAYYEVEVGAINFISGISFIIGIPVAIAGTYVVEKIGLKKFIHLTMWFVLVGSLFRLISSFPGLEEKIDKSIQYWLQVTGQIFIGIANPMAYCLPTKVAIDWFPPHESAYALGGIILAFNAGSLIGLSITPLVITEAKHIPYLQIMFFVPVGIMVILTLFTMRHSYPPTPPSKSAELSLNEEKISYWTKLKALLSNFHFLLCAIVVGGIQGVTNGAGALIRQIFCFSGYSGQFTGYSLMALLLAAVVSSLVLALIQQKTGHIDIWTKALGAGNALFMIAFGTASIFPDIDFLLATFLFLLGVCLGGALSIGIEACSECAYPVDPAAQVSILNLSNLFHAALLIIMSGPLFREIPEDRIDIQSCSVPDDPDNSVNAKDTRVYLIFVEALVAVEMVIFIAFLKIKMKKTRANMTLSDSKQE